MLTLAGGLSCILTFLLIFQFGFNPFYIKVSTILDFQVLSNYFPRINKEYLLTQVNKSIGMSNIYLKVTFEKNCRSQNFDFLSFCVAATHADIIELR